MNEKTPGIDGLPVEFYKCFWIEIRDIFWEAIVEAKSCKHLSITQSQGIISLLPKPEKDVLYLKNWRPLTLMNVDYKILTGCIANRIKKILDTIISKEQSGFVPGRYIGENIFKLSSIMEYCQMENIDGMLVLVDFQKAFDFLSWDYMEYVLNKFCIPEYIIAWVKIIYNDRNTACVLNNGWKSDFFKVQRGVKQGDPLSPLLYIICGEMLANAIKNYKAI